MKPFFLFSAFFGVATMLLPACKKDQSAAPAPDLTLQRLQHIWTYDVTYQNVFTNGTEVSDTLNGGPGDYFDFRTDMKAYTKWGTIRDTTAYSLPDDTHLVINGDTNLVQILTDNQLKFYGKHSQGANSYYEITDYLHR